MCISSAMTFPASCPSAVRRAGWRLCLVAMLGAGSAAHAERADRDKPMIVDSDNLRYDDIKQVSVLSGRVVLTKGTIVIRGAVLTVRQDADGAQHGVVTAEPGKLAAMGQNARKLSVDDSLDRIADALLKLVKTP